jgi:hypothetical protein
MEVFVPYSAADYEVRDDEQTRMQQRRLLSHITLGSQEQKRLVQFCADNVPTDRYVHPKLMSFFVDGGNAHSPVRIRYKMRQGSAESKAIHKHALGHLSDIAGLKRTYLGFLDEDTPGAWKRELLVVNLNTLYANQRFLNKLKREAEFLHRTVNGQLRAVLTQSYNRHLVSAAVLQPFLEVCQEVGLAPIKAHITDTRVHLQTYLPFAFQPYPGEFVAIGTCWGNSDFGEGKVKISHNVLRLNGQGSFITGDAFSRIHIGSVVQDTDIKLDDRAAVKELEAVAAAEQSAVREVMKPESVQTLLNAIGKAHAEDIPWVKLRDRLNKALSKSDVSTIESFLTDGVIDLPKPGVGSDGEPLPSKWWAAAALSLLAEKQTDTSKSMEIKALAGTYLLRKPAEASDG